MEFSPETRALLAAADEHDEPSESDRSRVRRALAASIGAGVAGLVALETNSASGGAAPPQASAAPPGITFLGRSAIGIAAKSFGLLALAAAVYGGVTLSRPRAHAARAGLLGASPAVTAVAAASPSGPAMAEVITPSHSEAPPAAASTLHEASSRAEAPQTRASLAPRPRERLGAAARNREARPAGVDEHPEAKAPADIAQGAGFAPTLDAENRLMHAGVEALQAGDPARALALFDEHEHRYPNGVLAEERAVERIFALCDLGRADDAKLAAREFARGRGGSPLVSQIQISCAASALR